MTISQLANTHEETLAENGMSNDEFEVLKQELQSDGFNVENIDGTYFASVDGEKSDLDFATPTDAWMFINENKHCGIL